ncbi:hypothetical protein BTA51_27265 [Hahella sp. CCB-MM4]|uniref:hypothetical protein n=1 Tax=Hahella sp. (strain CCB-MM4) TaxID=1926491 RepID=UPI000B9A475F|nr:hypothetical protein [Hahella sp. CCB-MM4]OZG70177.1 hypothetical protein BTA51_27265 [Hahella sp. CCB-MM4]
MKALKLKSLIAVALAVATLGANAESIADRRAEKDFTADAVPAPYSGTHTVLRGEIIKRDNSNVEVAAQSEQHINVKQEG